MHDDFASVRPAARAASADPRDRWRSGVPEHLLRNPAGAIRMHQENETAG